MRKLTAALLALLLLAGCAPGDGPAGGEIRRRALTIALDETWTAAAELTYPAGGDGPWPAVILFHGSGPMDMDATNVDAGGRVVSANFRLLAERLARSGYVVLRFHKRGVRRPGDYDPEQAYRATTNQLIADAGRVIAAAREQPEVDGGRIYLYGWSQGAQVAAHAALADRGVAGVILQGPPTGGWAETLRYQHLELGLRLLAEVDADGDGKLSAREWMDVPPGPAALMGSFYVWAPDSTPWASKMRADTDRDGDGLIDLEAELRPAIEALIANPAVNPMMDPANEPAESLAEIAPRLGRPVLILHGEHDGFVPVSDGEAIAAAAPETATLRRLPGLGHALSPTADPARDEFGPMDEAAIAALLEWLQAQAAAR
ncbi:alpha/beta hydrolase [Symbiobacterium thermophilum]|uniref:AB hydrolase-1 domain-containing protein n=1 Tax=Symbiobacterium thermophilum (strain DSM 24528 / JCM 14929 / IAM 14863 / T) TaxID=292459 RepID=Q67RL1_SYMTH|nr:alpha/beta fold hydrolase [Symbiobacterium thermophilum]BAD39682.1 conserved hypothetical protein [Symbiobacterium thermophilum IAM 14863]